MACFRTAGEGCEKLPLGGFEKVENALGILVAKKGHGLIHESHAKEGRQSLRLLGGKKREVELILRNCLRRRRCNLFGRSGRSGRNRGSHFCSRVRFVWGTDGVKFIVGTRWSGWVVFHFVRGAFGQASD